MKTLRNPILAAAALLITPMGAAWADLITINLDQSSFDAQQGQTLLFAGTITSLDSQLHPGLNGCDVNMSGQFTTDCTQSFLLDAPFTVDPTATTVDFAMFTVAVNIPYTDPLGPQTGTLDVLGDEETSGPAGDLDPLGSVGFTVNVTPEPGTATLLWLGGLFVVVVQGWRSVGRRRTTGAR